MAEDSRADLFLIRQAISAAQIDAAVAVVHDGHEAVAFIDTLEAGRGSVRPDLLLLDLNLPKKDGIEVLRHMRNCSSCKNLRVVVVTSSDSARDREAADALGFNGYFRKPSVYAEFMKLGHMIKEVLGGTTGVEQ